MCFDLHHCRFNSCRFVEGLQSVQGDVRQSDGAAFSMVDEIFHRPPSVEQSHAFIVDDIAMFIAWILLIPRLKRKRSMNEIEIQIVEPKPVKARLESRCDTLGSMIRVPQFCGHKDVFARESSRSKP